ncbi:HepT-like ribonuclease domain-containing protein [Rhizobium terricola]|nr:HepT-like ribonuclease domain-containing protein [Rhizobium terricola]
MPFKRPLTRLRDIVENAEAIFDYMASLDRAAFEQNRLVYDATERCLSRISEASVKLGSFAEEHLPAHNWRGMRDLGNILRHDYDGISKTIVWSIVKDRLPPLLADIKQMLSRYPDDQEVL